MLKRQVLPKRPSLPQYKLCRVWRLIRNYTVYMNNDVETALTDHYKRVVSNTLLLTVVSIHKNTYVLVMGTTSDPFDIWLIFLEVRSGETCYWHTKLLFLDYAAKCYGVSQLRFRLQALHHNDLEFKYQN